MRDGIAGNPEADRELRKPVQSLDLASLVERLKDEKTYQDHGRGVLTLAHEPSLRLALTAIAAGHRTGERRVAGTSTVQVLAGEVRVRTGEERHVLPAGGLLVLQGDVSYDAEAMSDAAFLHTLVQPVEHAQRSLQAVHPTEPAEGRADLDLPGPIEPGAVILRRLASRHSGIVGQQAARGRGADGGITEKRG